jgi:hypothetical protein
VRSRPVFHSGVNLPFTPVLSSAGIIEKSAIEGQKQYHSDLEKAMRAYIATHRNEFVEEGQDPDASAAIEDAQAHADDSSAESDGDEAAAGAAAKKNAGSTSQTSAHSSGPLAPLWALIEPVLQTLAEQSPTSLALGAVVVILLLSNLWTLRGSGRDDTHPAERARRQVLAGRGLAMSEGGGGGAGPPDEVANAVRDVLNNYFASAQANMQAPKSPPAASNAAPITTTPVEKHDDAPATDDDAVDDRGGTELEELAELLDRVEERARRLRAELAERKKASESAPTGLT